MSSAKSDKGNNGEANKKIVKTVKGPVKAKIQYLIQNQGAPNEHLVMIQQFNEPGSYTYHTTCPGNATLPHIRPVDQRSLNKGVNQAADLLTNPVIPDFMLSGSDIPSDNHVN